LENGTEQTAIHYELFTAGNKKVIVNPLQVSHSEQDNVELTIIQDGRSLIFNTQLGGNNILDTALANGADLPYACKGGVCCTCKAKLIKGTVHMEVNYGLEKDELENGYILTCQSVPTSKKVEISYDL
jgi:ring-1,2-phenylacetyl-CoA epoxidase subunit PaaE